MFVEYLQSIITKRLNEQKKSLLFESRYTYIIMILDKNKQTKRLSRYSCVRDGLHAQECQARFNYFLRRV